MAEYQFPAKVSVDVYEENRKFFASVDFADSKHALGPAGTRDEIYQLVFSFISDIPLVAEINNTNRKSGRAE